MACLFPFSITSTAVTMQNCLELLSASHMFIDNLQDEKICRLIFFPVMWYFKCCFPPHSGFCGWNDLGVEQLFGLWNWEKILKLATSLGLGWKEVNLTDKLNEWLINFKLYKLFYVIFDILFSVYGNFLKMKWNLFSLESIFSVDVFKPLTMTQYTKCLNIVILFFI